MLAQDRTFEDHLQYVIWIDSHPPSNFTLSTSSRLAYRETDSLSSPLDSRVAIDENLSPAPRMHEVKFEWLERWKAAGFTTD